MLKEKADGKMLREAILMKEKTDILEDLKMQNEKLAKFETPGKVLEPEQFWTQDTSAAISKKGNNSVTQ